MSDADWKQYFNDKAAAFGGSVKTSDYFNEKSFFIRRDNTLQWLGELKDKEILDAGCGVGAFSEPLVSKNMVCGVDFSEKSLEFAKQRGLKGYCGDLGQLPFEDGKFDLILCIGVIQHIKEYKKIIVELGRVVKPGGTLLIETLNKFSVQRKLLDFIGKSNKNFDLMFGKEELKSLLVSLGFEDIEFMSMYHPMEFVTYSKNEGIINKYFSTSFAIKGRKR